VNRMLRRSQSRKRKLKGKVFTTRLFAEPRVVASALTVDGPPKNPKNGSELRNLGYDQARAAPSPRHTRLSPHRFRDRGFRCGVCGRAPRVGNPRYEGHELIRGLKTRATLRHGQKFEPAVFAKLVVRVHYFCEMLRTHCEKLRSFYEPRSPMALSRSRFSRQRKAFP